MRILIGPLAAAAALCAATPAAARIGGPVPPGPPFSSGHVPLGAAVLHCNSDEVGGDPGVVLLNNNGFHGKGTCEFP